MGARRVRPDLLETTTSITASLRFRIVHYQDGYEWLRDFFSAKLDNLQGKPKVSLGILALDIRVSLELSPQYVPEVELKVE